MKPILLIFLISLACFGFETKKNTPMHQKLAEVLVSTQNIRTLSYEFIKSERINGQMADQHAFIKLNRAPFRVYLKELSPNNGVEVLYPCNEEPSKALVKPNGFPWINLKLDPKGDLMRRNQHHTILESGFDYGIKILAYGYNKHHAELEDLVQYNGTTDIDGLLLDVYTLTNPNFEYISYTVLDGETVADIAKKYMLSQHMIMDKNGMRYSDEVQSGQIIKIPNEYCSKMILYVDQRHHLPIMMKIFDEKGLYEKYYYKNVKVNPTIMPVEFSQTYFAYGFN